MTVHEFVCAVCGQLRYTRTTEAEANREFLESGMPASGGALHSVCDDCYELVMNKAREQGLLTSAEEGVADRNTPPPQEMETEK